MAPRPRLPMNFQVSGDYRPVGRIFAAAVLAQKHLPRGKGAVPRYVGRAARRKPTFLVTRHGARLAMSSEAWDVYATIALNGGSWDYHDFKWCVTGMPQSGVFYDIGANVGYFSVEMAKILGPAVQVVAFEPQPDLAVAINHSSVLNGTGNVHVVEAIVGDAAGLRELFVAPASIHASAVTDSGRPCVGSVAMRMVTVDDMVEAGEIPPPDMVKMDVEGSEHLVFRGAGKTFRACRPHIFLEFRTDFDPGARVRDQVEQLVRHCPEYELFGHTRTDRTSGPNTWFRIRSEDDWPLVNSLFLKNIDRPVRDPVLFEHDAGCGPSADVL
jgi:FkbM family methyltransferase